MSGSESKKYDNPSLIRTFCSPFFISLSCSTPGGINNNQLANDKKEERSLSPKHSPKTDILSEDPIVGKREYLIRKSVQSFD